MSTPTPGYDPDRIPDLIANEQYHHFPGTSTVVCHITTTSGYYLTGESSCADPSKFSYEDGMRIAFQNALRRLRQNDTYHRLALRAARRVERGGVS